MDSKKNDKLDPTTVDGQHGAESVGLSSAMHDIRMLARRYESESQAKQAGDSLHLAEVTSLQPQHLLQPVRQTSSDRWKGPALMLLMLLGLSTSALALSLFSAPETLPEPTYLDAGEATFSVSRAVSPAAPTHFPREEPRYQTSEEVAVEVAVEGGIEAPKTPTVVRKSAAPRARARVSRSVTTPEPVASISTCDEVACLLDSSDPCCSQYPSVAQRESVLEASKPYRPERSAIMKAMKGIEDDVLDCFTRYGETGIAAVDFTIAADGHLTGIELDQGTLGFRACVRDQVSSVSFAPLQAPFKMSFPFRK